MSIPSAAAGRSPSNHALRLAARVGFVAVLLGAVLGGAPVSAHADFGSSQPANGDVVAGPVELVTVVFTGEVTPVGDEFVARTPTGALQQPVAVSTADDKVFSIRFDPPLAGGEIGIRWNVQAADSHPITGAFSFAVTAPAPTTVPAVTTTPSTVPAAAAPTTVVDVITDTASSGSTDAAETGAGSLEEFLTVDEAVPGETTATTGRVIGFLGVALGLGVLAFAATTLRGSRAEVVGTLNAVRVLGVVIVVGALVEHVGVTRIAGDSFWSSWATSPGIAAGLRALGGIALAVGIAATVRPTATARPLSAAVVDARLPADEDLHRGPSRPLRWVPDARSRVGLVAIALLLASFWFDGHTVNKGIRPLHALVNTVHLAAGSVWVGGVVAMAAIAWTRHRAGRPTRGADLVVRFSSVATVALGAVVVAGALMAVFVLDSFGELTGTEWGQILLLKTAAVGLAAVGGAYNHFRLLPALRVDPESPELQARLRSTVTAEAIMLVFVVIVTAWLVAAAS